MYCPIYNCHCQYIEYGCPKLQHEMSEEHYQRFSHYQYPDPGGYEKVPEAKKNFTTEEAYKIGKMLGIDWNKSKFDVEQYRLGLNVELEHGRRDPFTNVTNDNPLLTGKIALAHLNEFPDYYTRLAKLESEAKAYWGTR